MTTASIHKINRNNYYKIELSGNTVITSTVSDNGFINRILPFYKESVKWFKSYLSTPASFVNYVLFSATYTGSPLNIPSQEVNFVSPRFSDYRKDNSSLYDNLNHKEYQDLRLGDLAKLKRDQENNNVYVRNEPLIYNNQSRGEKTYTNYREPPIDYSNELIKYNINEEVDGYTSVYDMDFAHQVLNDYYNNRNKQKKYRKLDAILRFNGDVKLSHKQTVYPNQNDIWERTRPYFSFDSWNSNQDYRRTQSDFEYEYSGEDSIYSGTFEYDFNPIIESAVNILLLDQNELLIGGEFTRINGYEVDYISKLKTSNFDFNPLFNPKASSYVFSFDISGSNLYVAGDFNTFGGLPRNGLASLDKDTALMTAWNPGTSGNGDTVHVISINGNNVYVGGSFDTLASGTRNYLGSVHKDTGALLPFNPNCDGEVRCLIISGSNLYIGGTFTTVSGSTRNRIAAVHKDSGALLPFDPNIDTGFSCNSMIISGSNLYLGGFFSSVSGTSRNNIAVVNKDSGALGPFNPNCNSTINCLLISGSNLYIGGDFTTISGSSRNSIGIVNKDSGALGPFNPFSSFSGEIKSLVISGSNLYIGGDYLAISGSEERDNLAVVDKNSGMIYATSLSITSSIERSIWPLDAWIDPNIFPKYIYGEYLTGTISNINDSFRMDQSWMKPFRFTFGDLLMKYNFLSSSVSVWTVPEETNSFPFFDSEKDYLQNIKSKYKNYSSIPEYLVSNFINDYSLNSENYDIYLSGTNLSNQEIFTNNNSQLKNVFNIKKEINKNLTKIEFKLNYVNLFRPYRNLYPVEKVLQISKILLTTLEGGEINGNYSGLPIIESQSIMRNFLLEPFVSPGILWNTIKTGVPYIWPYMTQTVDEFNSPLSSSISYPFESIYNPFKYLNNSPGMYSRDLNKSLSNITFSGSFYDEKYTDCITNFIKDSSDFFLNTVENFTYFSSKPENDFDVFLSGSTYGMILSLDNYFDTASTQAFTSISPGPFSLGTYEGIEIGNSEFYSLYSPMYMKYYEELFTNTSSPTFNKVKILFTPTDTGKYTLAEIISSSIVVRDLTDERRRNDSNISSIREYGQNMLKSYNIFEFERFDQNNKKWNISGKWEVPIFDFSSAISKFTDSDYPYYYFLVGYGHQFGKKQHGRSNLTLNIKDVSGSFSLADAVGFYDRSYQLGKLKEVQEANELICVVPFNSSKNQLISIDSEDVNYKNINYFDYYMFPIKYDYKYGSASPYLMYCFETSMNLYSDDLSKIWQNVMPSQSFNHEEGVITVVDDITNNPKLNQLFEDNISWMIFKVKKRSVSNSDGKHTFNWPYDNFSITELSRLDIELTYDDIKNFKSTLDPSAIGKKAKQKSSRDIEFFEKEETKKRIFPVKGPETTPPTPQDPIPNQEQQDPNRVFPVKEQQEPTTQELIDLGEQWRFVSIPDEPSVIPPGYIMQYGFLTRDPNVIDVTNRR